MNPTLGRQMAQEMAEQPGVLAALAGQLPDWTNQIKTLASWGGRRGIPGAGVLRQRGLARPVCRRTSHRLPDLPGRAQPHHRLRPAAGRLPRVAAGGRTADCVLSTIRGQQLALAICRQRGIDPDHPAGLNKITLTH